MLQRENCGTLSTGNKGIQLGQMRSVGECLKGPQGIWDVGWKGPQVADKLGTCRAEEVILKIWSFS